MTDYFTENKLFTPLQFGFRKNSSTEHALIAITDFITNNLSDKKVVTVVQLDLSKAFDKVDHHLLLLKLKWYGVDCQWFESYLTKRSHTTRVGESESKEAFPQSGVPQGSILGPLLFTIFINDLPNVLKYTFPVLYADDTHLCHASSIGNVQQMSYEVNEDLSAIQVWMDNNGMELNTRKCKVLIIYPKNLRDTKFVPDIHINGCKLDTCENIKSLGLIIDSNWTWKPHINDVCRQVNFKLYTLKQILSFCSFKNRKLLCSAHCISLIRYCSIIWGTSNKSELVNIDKCVQRCARAVYKKSKFESISDELTSLGWFVSDEMYKYAILMFVFLVLHDMCPDYFSNYVITKQTPYCTKYPNHITLSTILPIQKYAKCMQILE